VVLEETGQKYQGYDTMVSMLVGFSGQTSALLAFLLLLLKTPSIQIAGLEVVAAVPVACLLLVLMFAASFSVSITFFVRHRAVLYAVAGVGTIFGILLLVADALSAIALLLVSASIVALIILWVQYLSTLKYQFLNLQSTIALVLLGAFGLFVTELSGIASYLIALVLSLVSLACALFVNRRVLPVLPKQAVSDPKRSWWRKLVSKEEWPIPVLLGFMMGAAVMMLTAGTANAEWGGLATSIAIVFAGFTVMVFRLRFKAVFEESVMRLLTAFIIATLLPMPFLPSQGVLICGGVLLFAALVGLVIAIDGTVESCQDAPFLLIANVTGKGVLFLLPVAAWIGIMDYVGGRGLDLVCYAAVILASLIQVVLDNWGLKSNLQASHQGRESLDKEPDDDPGGIRGGAIWKIKLDYLAREHSLSPRQKQIMKLLVKGRDSHYIMNSLDISRSTAKTHVSNIYKKIEIHSRQELLDLVEQIYVSPELVERYEEGLIDSDRLSGQMDLLRPGDSRL
jgi:DNA-binding CsgD family transcriptional regulator